jgi:hypothetical protein
MTNSSCRVPSNLKQKKRTWLSMLMHRKKGDIQRDLLVTATIADGTAIKAPLLRGRWQQTQPGIQEMEIQGQKGKNQGFKLKELEVCQRCC